MDLAERIQGLPQGGHYSERGPRVEMMVGDCSDSLTVDAENMTTFRERKIAHLQHAVHDLSRVSVLVAVCDKVANLGHLVRYRHLDGDETLHSFNGGAEGT